MPANRRLRALSIQLPLVGNKTYGEFVRHAFADDGRFEMTALWTHEQREIAARLLNRAMYLRFPSSWIRSRNLDMSRVRREFGYAYYGRRHVERYLAKATPDVLHFHTQTPALLSSDYMRRIPTVITTDQTAVQMAYEMDERWRWTHAPSARFERGPLRAAAAVVVFSQWAAASMIGDLGVAPERVHVIPPGVDTGRFDAMHRNGTHAGTEKILFVGADFVRKGGALLVDVFLERFAARGAQLHIVSPNAPLPAHPQIFVHSDVAAYSPDWHRLYNEADVFVLPTRWDAFGLAYIEAMAAGVPVIGTAINAGPEIILDGQTGFLIAPDDPRALAERLERLLGDASLRREFGERGRARVRTTFDARTNAAHLERVFLGVLGTRA